MKFKDPIYGSQEITEPVILDILATPQMERLKGIHHLGIMNLIGWGEDYSRWDHSLGVFFGLRHFQAREEEQVAGLLHDISHTVFSHTLDFLYNLGTSHDLAERFLKRFYHNTELGEVLKNYMYDSTEIVKLERYPLLDNHLPDLCLDRIDYCLRDPIVLGLEKPEAMQKLLQAMVVFDGQVVFKDQKAAKRFGDLYTHLNDNYWNCKFPCYYYHKFSEIVGYAMKQGLVTIEDLFSTDEAMIKKLDSSKSRKIKDGLKLLRSEPELVEDEKNYDLHLRSKVRWIDPPVLVSDNETKRLSELDAGYQKKITESSLTQEKLFP